MRNAILSAFVVLSFSLTGAADTLFFKDGSSLEGKVQRVNENTIALVVGQGRMQFQTSEIERIEENDKQGDYQLVSPMATRHDRALKARTGLTREQRNLVRRHISGLTSASGAERLEARKALIQLGEEVDIFPFLKEAAPFLPADRSPEVLRVLWELDPKRAKPVLMEMTTNALSTNRAQALELMCTDEKADESARTQLAQLVARGMVDPSADVRIAAAKGLGALGAKGATPALIEGARSSNPRLQGACKEALEKIWRIDPNLAEGMDWDTLWNDNKQIVREPLQCDSLEPLYKPEVEGQAPYFLAR